MRKLTDGEIAFMRVAAMKNDDKVPIALALIELGLAERTGPFFDVVKLTDSGRAALAEIFAAEKDSA